MATPLQNTLSRTLMNGNLTINGNISVNSTNIALGFQAGNIINGDQVGLPNGSLTTAVGSYSGMNHTGTNNTFIGSVAGQSSTSSYFSRTGSNNTYVGYAAQANGTYSNSTAIGTGAIITASNQIVLGTTVEQVVIKGNLYSKATATNQSIATFEGPGGGGNTVNIDFCSYLNSSRTPTNRIACIDDGAYSGHYAFYSKTPGADANPLTERMRIASDGTVSIPGKLIQTGAVHISFYESSNLTYYNTAGTQITSGQYTHVSVKFNSVLNNLNWGTPSYLNNAKLIVPYTGLYFIQFTFASTNCDKEVFIGKNSNNIGSSDTIAYCQIGFLNAISISGTAYLAAGDAINIGFYSSISGAYATYGNRSVYNISMIARTA